MYVVVVDEMSMVDNKLFKDALTTMMAPNSNGVFILLGDVNQLSSIGAGDVLNQLIESGKVPTTRLTTVYRQGGENGRSGIADALQSVLNGKVPTSSDGFKWIQTEDPARLKFNLCRRAELLQDIWMMTPTNSTIDAYQTHVRETINPDTDQPSFKTKFHDFRVGDKVIQRVNDYNRGVYNGMLGFVVGIEEKQIKKKVFVDGKHSVIMGNETYTTVQFENTVSAVYTVEELSQLRWAYITTVHAAQGSESKNVVVVMTHAAGRLLNRNLLYTALSRAKTSCVLLAPEMCVRMAVSTNVPKRTTNLASML
jgi:exodeoxyribonuclease V alpha subunit